MSLALVNVQQALYSKLVADGVLMGMVSGVFDAVPQRTAMPYVVIGDGELASELAVGVNDARCRLELNVWSTPQGRKTVLTIMDRMYGLLHQSTLSVSGYTLVAMQCDAARTELVEEGPHIKGTLVLELLLRSA